MCVQNWKWRPFKNKNKSAFSPRTMNSRFLAVASTQGIKKRCRLSWLTNSALVYEPKCGGRGLWGLSQWVQLYTWSPHKLWRSNSIFNLWVHINPTLLARARRALTGYTGSRKTKREGGGATVAVSADGEMSGWTQTIRQQKKSVFFPFIVPWLKSLSL